MPDIAPASERVARRAVARAGRLPEPRPWLTAVDRRRLRRAGPPVPRRPGSGGCPMRTRTRPRPAAVPVPPAPERGPPSPAHRPARRARVAREVAAVRAQLALSVRTLTCRRRAPCGGSAGGPRRCGRLGAGWWRPLRGHCSRSAAGCPFVLFVAGVGRRCPGGAPPCRPVPGSGRTPFLPAGHELVGTSCTARQRPLTSCVLCKAKRALRIAQRHSVGVSV